ncbi:silent information regulator protein Sir2 [Sphingobacterium alkalisoli]|uniref:Silent information regulator protein Sir2 n=1 Tax=Sphingobacterium alkalisoli TaxID=1874115 RepID=A0A4U0GU86_9SPHI|nr:silent information regulator protein Sir2 [Sphingobacterium alkalisoli]TJY62641.1 silent information regulator protein Sir2 [Sphingobacterium alkalisoli]GGH27948.1 rhamnogalacturonan exolyase YesX [Sphingobacterium alkalisoli]
MNYIKILFIIALISVLNTTVLSQDSRERSYMYEILTPRHAIKPEVNGFAQKRVEEPLDRGLTLAHVKESNAIHISWRLLKSDNEITAFNIYRSVNDVSKKLNKRPITETTDFVDTKIGKGNVLYWIETIQGEERSLSKKKSLPQNVVNESNYHRIKLKDPSVTAGRVAVADLNGDGQYDYIIRHPNSNVDPGVANPNDGTTYKIEAYLHDGTYLWTRDLGPGIEPGVWYSPFIVYDFDGDGKAEVALKTAGDDFLKNDQGRVYGGSEHLSIWNGMTGEEIALVDWPERNDRYGDVNRQNRNQIGMAYLDGKTPCILAARGTYRLMVVDAWQLNNGKLEKLWRWDGDEENPVVRSQGAHNMVSGDVDGDGKDEILLGSCMLNNNGTLRWSTGLGHSDKAYLTDIDPERKGLEVFLAIEPWIDNGYGVSTVDANNGERIWGVGHKTFHVGDGMVADIDPTSPGLECFATEDRKGGSTDKYLLSAQGKKLGSNEEVPPCRNWIWWDSGNIRQLFFGDDNRWGAESTSGGRNQSIGYWNGDKIGDGIYGDILMIADLFGDWREEVVTALPGELRVYHTTIPAKDRKVTLMQDPIYRSYVLQRSQGYPQAPVPSYYLGN